MESNKNDSGEEKIGERRSGMKNGLVESTRVAPILSHVSLNEVAKCWHLDLSVICFKTDCPFQ